jgi:hypothetical protein
VLFVVRNYVTSSIATIEQLLRRYIQLQKSYQGFAEIPCKQFFIFRYRCLPPQCGDCQDARRRYY